MNIFDFLGLFGSFIIAYVYFYSQFKNIFLNSFLFYLLNILGSSLIIFSLIFSSFNIASFSIESLWIFVSLYGIFKYHLKKDGEDVFNGTVYQDELSVDNIPVKVELKEFKKDGIGEEIIFEYKNNKYYEKAAIIESFSYNGTYILTPYAIIETEKDLNSLNRIEYLEPFLVKTIDLKEINIKLNKKEKYFIYFKNNEKGINEDVLNKVLEFKDNIIGYITDGQSFEQKGHQFFPSTVKLMDIDKKFKPLIYCAKTTNKDYKYVKLNIGNTPIKAKLPGYPIEIFFLN